MNPDKPPKGPEKARKIISLPDGSDPWLLNDLFVKPEEPISLKGTGPNGENGEWVFTRFYGMRSGGNWKLYDMVAKFTTEDGNELGPFQVSCRISREPGKSFVKIWQVNPLHFR